MKGHNNRLLVIEQSLRRRPPVIARSLRIPSRPRGRQFAMRSVRAFTDSVNYEVPPLVPTLAQPNPMACWATATAILHSWRDQQSRSIEDIISDIPGDWIRLLVNGDGLPLKDKETFLSAAGLIHEPPMNFSARGWESLLRTYGPLWVTTQNELKSETKNIHGRILIGIRGDGTANGTTMTIIDPGGGRKYAESLGKFVAHYEEVIDGIKSLPIQVVHLPADARMKSATVTAPAIAQAVTAAGAGVVVTATGVGYTILKEALTSAGDMSWTLNKMEGFKHPLDNIKKYGVNKPGLTARRGTPVKVGGMTKNGFGLLVGLEFQVDWYYNGHAVGNISMVNTKSQDLPGFGAVFDSLIMPRPEVRNTAKGPVAVIELILSTHINRSIGDDWIFIENVLLWGDGTVDKKGTWTQ